MKQKEDEDLPIGRWLKKNFQVKQKEKEDEDWPIGRWLK